MKISFEQLFYGRSERGYGILGSSSGGRAFAVRIESLCGAVGTPGADYNGDSFLLSVPVGDCIVMLCGRRGEPDSIGRATLFFHALVANKAELSSAGADAFSLFSQGAFLGKMPAEEIGVLCVDVAQSRAGAKESPFDATFPCVIRSAKPAPEVIRGVVGENTLNRSWATFAFQSMQDFDVQVLPPRVSCPRDLSEYDAAGRLVCSAAISNSGTKDEVPQKRSNETPRSPIEKTADVTSKNKSSAMFKLSIFVNVVLAIVCGVLLAFRTTSTDRSDVTIFGEGTVGKTIRQKLTALEKGEIENAAVMQFIEGLKSSFPREKKISDFEASIKRLPNFEVVYPEIMRGEHNESNVAKPILDSLKEYVIFLNNHILEKKTP